MQVTLDRAGRILIPKQVRDALGLAPGTKLEVAVEGEGLRLEPVRRQERTVEVSDGLPRLGRVDDVQFTNADVRRLRQKLQR